ncbi:TetR/AcrR family transcriptional regulator [Hungatella hathewayi]|uniref:TetR/AcrR family transcriptional regulator n=1 Tax=Hungatella hathewayi TaxID=154046 RepID=UPI003D80E0EB
MNEQFYDLPQEKQMRIINAGLEVFSKNDYKHAVTDEIARKAGISKGLLFYYFHNKKVQFTRDYTGYVSDGRGFTRQIFHVIFKLSLVAAMVVIIKSTTRRLSSKDTFSQVSR